MSSEKYPITFSVDYPNRELDRVTSFFRIFAAIPILIVSSTVSGTNVIHFRNITAAFGAGGLLFLGPLLMIVFRQKYPRWWFDWNLELLRFGNRLGVYLLLMDDKYPSTDEEQSTHFSMPYPVVKKDLNRWLPLVKWFLAIPHYLVLIVLDIAVMFAAIVIWFAILFTGRYPKSIFNFVEGVMRWNLRVFGFAFIMVTDKYPPFSLS